MLTSAILLSQPQRLARAAVSLKEPGPEDVVVDVEWTGISAGTERLLWSGEMPPFPGLGYPLVPGYEAVGRIAQAPDIHRHRLGERVFVPGAQCFTEARGLFGAAAGRLVVPAGRAKAIDAALGSQAVLFALAATAHHILAGGGAPELIVGHGTLGRLLARLTLTTGAAPPTVWERAPARRRGPAAYPVIDPAEDGRRDYRTVADVSGDAALLDTLIGHLAPGGEIVLGGFYKEPIRFAFPPAFMREIRLRVAAEWRDGDFDAVRDLVAAGRLSLDGLVTDHADAHRAPEAYATAFNDPDCLKMVLDWKAAA